ncbi:MAG TPA: hypothetical protein P5235_08970 [Saprospiraceae bacterium]|nr:hypothetical protein [Saprospiraceae bacterium]
MAKYIVILFTVSLFFQACKKSSSPDETPNKLGKEISAKFPNDCYGEWSGNLLINNGHKIDTILMDFAIRETDSPDTVQWILKYEGQDSRNYELITVNEKNGDYLIDEKNGIVINAKRLGNQIFSSFEVMDNQISAIYSFENEEIIFEIIVQNSKEFYPSGDTIVNGENIPEVKSFPVTMKQTAQLQRKK